MPGAGSTQHAPVTSPRVLARRRAVAAAAVAACLVADVVGVAAAASSDEGSADSAFAAMSRIGVASGTAPARLTTTGAAGSDRAAAEDAAEADDDSTVESVPGAKTPKPAAARAPKAVKVIESGSGTFRVLPLPSDAVKTKPTSGRKVTYTLEIEGGLGIGASGYSRAVVADLTDARGWQKRDQVRFVNVSPAQVASGTKPDLRITLASPDTTDRLCAPLQTRGQVSCHNGGRVVLNARRWLLGADAYGKNLTGYRIYLVNHEVGHGIGHGHVKCAANGQPAQVMMQQTYGLQGCTAWPWPATKPNSKR